MASHINKSLQLSALCIALACVHTSAWAIESLESLDDDSLAEATGEGIAFLPEQFAIQMNGADATNSGAGTYGAGYMHIIPVGPLSATAAAKGYKKADGWLYGTSVAQSKKNLGVTIDSTDWGVPFGGIGNVAADFGRPIASWGTAENPWIFKTLTEENVPNFAGTGKSVTYMTLEAPRYHVTLPASGTPASSAYNLKLGLWSDFFVRDAAVAENGYDGLSNRLRLAFVWDGFSINGSNVKIFQTLDGVTTANKGGTYNATLKVNGVNTTKTFNYGMGTDYNKTFGMAGLVRLNSRKTDGSDARGTMTLGTVTRKIYQLNYSARDAAGNPIYTQGVDRTSSPNTSDGILTTYQPLTNSDVPGSFPNSGMCTAATANQYGNPNEDNEACRYQEGFTARRFVASATNSWTPPATKSVIRLSTQELSGSTSGTGTPALAGATGTVPDFRPNTSTNAEGVFLYDANINLVLGSLYQPLMLSTDGNNFSIELARIPNVPAIYRKVYQRYEHIDPSVARAALDNPATTVNEGAAVDADITYGGSTCNIHQCGTVSALGGVNYQGNTATHSSITIGSTVRETSRTVTNSAGVSHTFTGLNLLKGYSGIEAYGVSIGELKAGTGLTGGDLIEDFTQVWYKKRNVNRSGFIAYSYSYGAWDTNWTAVTPKAAVTGNPDPYETTYRQNRNSQILGVQTTMPTNPTTYLNNMTPVGKTVSNNFGSVAIDGLLIQHFKFTTTGL